MIADERSSWRAIVTLVALAAILGYLTFQWGGVVGTYRYQILFILGLAVMLWNAGRPFRRNPLPVGRMFQWATVLFPAYVLFQVAPLPISILRVLSPMRAGATDALAQIGGKVNFAPLSVVPAGTFQYFLLVCAYVVTFLIVRDLTWHFSDKRWVLVWPILGIATFESCLGLWQYFGAPGRQDRWGTYANYNHYAGFLEMVLPFAVMYPVAVLHRAHSRWHSSIGPVLMASGVWALALMIFSGIILSLSRMGFIATLSSLFVMASLMIVTTKVGWVTRSRLRRSIGVGMVAALIVVGFVLLPPERLIQRFAEFDTADGLNSEGRADLWEETVPLIKAYPVFGCGLGEYMTAFSRFKVTGMLLTVDFAHNDYLQLLAELGLAGFAILAALAVSMVRIGLSGAMNSTESEARYFAVACLGGLSAIALHSFTDFNLYIPANAMLLSWIAGMTAGSRQNTVSAPERGVRATRITIETPEVVALH